MTFLRNATIRPSYFLIALLPAAVLLVSVLILVNYGVPFDVPPVRVAEFSVPAEGAARITVLATFMIVIGTAGAAIGFLLYVLQSLSRTDWLLSGAIFVALAAGGHILPEGRIPAAEEYPGRTLFCIAAINTPADSADARAEELESHRERRRRIDEQNTQAGAEPHPALEAGVAFDRLRLAANCLPSALAGVNLHRNLDHPDLGRFARAHNLANLQYLLIVLAFAGLVVAAIGCLADPRARLRPVGAAPEKGGKGSKVAAASDASTAAGQNDPVKADRKADLAHWELQSARLNTCLYLGAFLLGSSLLFIGAFMRWPLYTLIDAAPYAAYVNSILAYYGSTFSVMLAAFYVPAAAVLSLKVGASAQATTGATKLPEAFQGPLQLLKIVLGVGGTAFAGALPQIIDMIA